MTRRLTLHIGSHKTGTTTLQHHFLRNVATLRERGLTFAHGRKSTLHEFLGQASRDSFLPKGFHLRDAEECAALLGAAQGDHVFASSENFSLIFQAEQIKAVAKVLRPIFDEVRILVYLRRQDRQAISHHQEGAKPHRNPAWQLWGHGLDPLPAPMPHHALYLDYDRRIGHWADAFGADAIEARIFDRGSLIGGELVTDVLTRMGISAEGLQPAEERNASLGAMQAWLGHLMNAARASETLIDAAMLAAGPGPRALPARARAEAFYAPYRDGNARLNERLKISPLPGLFNDDFDDYPEQTTPDWTFQTAQEALDVLVRALISNENPLAGHVVEDLRDAALALKDRKPETALRFAKSAQSLRPKGPGIRRLIDELGGAPTVPRPRKAARRAGKKARSGA